MPWWETGGLRVLVAEEDPGVRGALGDLLRAGVSATFCADGAEALWHAGRVRPAVVILSATLPLVAAADVAAVLSRHGEACGAIAVGVRRGEVDRAAPVLAAGATAVVSRPYRCTEIEPLLRAVPARPELGQAESGVLSAGALQLDGPAFEASAAGRPMRLTLRQFELLRLLMLKAGKVVSARDIRARLWEARGESVSQNTIAVHVRHLRAHLGDAASVVTVRGMGYRLVVADAEPDG